MLNKVFPIDQDQQAKLITFFLVITFFVFPLSTTLKSIFILLAIISIIIFSAHINFLKILKEPWCIATFLLFSIIAAGCFIGNANWQYKLIILDKYLKLLCLPVLAIGFQKKETRQWAIHAFLAAMLLTLCFSFLKILGFINFHSSHAHSPADVFNNHIVTGFLMAFAAYLSALYSKKANGYQRLGYAMISFLFSFHTLFINTGRTGYVIYALLFVLFFVQSIPLRKLPAYLFLPLIGIGIGLMTFKNTTFSERLKLGLDDIQQYEMGYKNTSLGFRLQFHQYAKKLFLSHPIQGVGTGGFSYHFNREKPIPAWGETLLDPHHQYWLMAAEHGILGEACLLFFFLTLFAVGRKLTETRPILIAALSAFLVANFIDSFLLFSSTGYFLILFGALSMGEASESAC